MKQPQKQSYAWYVLEEKRKNKIDQVLEQYTGKRKQNDRKRNLVLENKVREESYCVNCGHAVAITNYKRRFCTRVCSDEFRKKKILYASMRNETFQRHCMDCGKIFIPPMKYIASPEAGPAQCRCGDPREKKSCYFIWLKKRGKMPLQSCHISDNIVL